MKLCVWILWAVWMIPIMLVLRYINGTYAARLAFGAYVTGVVTGWVMYHLADNASLNKQKDSCAGKAADL